MKSQHQRKRIQGELVRLQVKYDLYKDRALKVDKDAKNVKGELLRDVYIESAKAYLWIISTLKKQL